MIPNTGSAQIVDASRETIERLECFSELILKWNPVINLVSKSTITKLWTRHICDSHQLHKLIPDGSMACVDLGSGGGFPGLVLAIESRQTCPLRCFTLIESDQRKSAFLREAARLLDLRVTVLAERIEAAPKQMADFLSARALAPLSKLLEWSTIHLAPHGTAAFLKGSTFAQEVNEARKTYSFECEVIPSSTDASGSILIVKGVRYAVT